MDSTRVRAREEPDGPEAPLESQPGVVSPEAATRLGRVLPLIDRGERAARRVAAVSAVAALVVAVALVRAPLEGGYVGFPLAAVAGLVLLAPAGLTWLAAGVLRDVRTLPGRLRAGAAEVAVHARTAVRGGGGSGPGGGRLFGVVRALWAARGVVLDVREGGWRVLALARLLRLASLPFVLLLAVAFLLNFAVIAAGVAALAALAF